MFNAEVEIESLKTKVNEVEETTAAIFSDKTAVLREHEVCLRNMAKKIGAINNLTNSIANGPQIVEGGKYGS